MTSSRDWTPIDDDPRWDDESYYDSVKPQADALARAWSQLQTQREQDGFDRQRAWEDGEGDGFDYPLRAEYDAGPDGDVEYSRDVAAYEAGLASVDAARKLADELEQAQIDLIETKLSELGARMMRPYEHWNEDEALVAYMERDR